MAVVDLPLHKNNDDVGVGKCLSEIDIMAEVLANEGPLDVRFSFSENEIQSESSNRENGENLDTQVIALTDIKAVSLNGKGFDNVGVDFSPSEIEQSSECLNSKNAVRDMDLKETAATYLKSEVLVNKVEWSHMDSAKNVVDMPGHDSKAVVDMQVHNITTEVLTNEVELLQMDSGKAVVDMPIQETEAVIAILSQQKKVSDDIGVAFSFSETELFIKSSERENESSKSRNDKNLDTEVIGLANMKGEILSSKGTDNAGVDEFFSQNASLNGRSDDMVLDAKDTAVTHVKSEVLIDKVEVFPVVPVKIIGEMPCHAHRAVVDMPQHKMKDDDGVNLSLPEIDTTTEVPAYKGSDDVGDHIPISEGFDDEVVHFSFSETDSRGSDDVEDHIPISEGSGVDGVHFSISESDERESPSRSIDSKESESLKEQLKMESSEEANFGEYDHDLMIQAKSGKNVFEWLSSPANSFVDVENLEISVKIQQNISCSTESDTVYDNEKGLSFQERVSGKAIDSDQNINSESYERTEKSIHNRPGDDTSADSDFFQYNVCSKQLDNKRKTVSEILSCNGVFEFADQIERSSETFEDNSCGTEAEFDFLEDVISPKQDRKRESVASQILGESTVKESADQSETPDSFNPSGGFSSKVGSYHQPVFGNSITKESRRSVASDVSGIKIMIFEERQTSEMKSSSSLKLSDQICPASAPPVLQPRKTNIADSQPPLIFADYPFTEKYISSGVQSLRPTLKLKSDVSYDKENIAQNKSKVELTKEGKENIKNLAVNC